MSMKPDKFNPIKGNVYLVTDQCGWEPLSEKEQKEYNPYDNSRKPHAAQLVDINTGTIVNLLAGSKVMIVEAKTAL